MQTAQKSWVERVKRGVFVRDVWWALSLGVGLTLSLYWGCTGGNPGGANAPQTDLGGDVHLRADAVTGLELGRQPDGKCKAGHRPVGAACVTDVGPCAYIDCSGRGTCGVTHRGLAACTCDAGYHSTALECVPSRTGCLERTWENFGAFPVKNHQEPGSWAESECIRVTNVPNPVQVSMAYDRGQLSINGAEWTTTATIKNNDVVRLRGEAHSAADGGNTIYMLAGDEMYGIFEYRTANTDRGPEVFQVGPERNYRQLSDVSGLLRAGDVVELDGDATYSPAEFKRAGTPAQPIWLRGVTVRGKRPVISGGEVGLSFRRGHHYVVDNLEVTGSSEVCIRTEADGLRFIDVFVHDCERHGILGADAGSGTVVFDRIEVMRAGAERAGESLKHGLYVATDYHAYPGSKLKVTHSYFHDNGGNAIKSRAERAEVYFNWIESRDAPGAYYTLEIIGFQEYPEHGPQNSDVVGNVLVNNGGNALRFGGDGSGESRGRVRLVNNTILVGAKYTADGAPVVRISGGFEALWLANNLLFKVGEGDPALRVWRHDQAEWTSGSPRAKGFGNWVPAGGTASEEYVPVNLKETQRGGQNPGLREARLAEKLDVGLTDDSVLVGKGSVAAPSADYVIDDPLTALWSSAPATRPVSGSHLKPVLRPEVTPPNVGAL